MCGAKQKARDKSRMRALPSRAGAWTRKAMVRGSVADPAVGQRWRARLPGDISPRVWKR